MDKNKKILIVGAGGFIGGHLVDRLLKNGNSIVATDIKPKEYWFQDFNEAENHYAMDMKDISNCIIIISYKKVILAFFLKKSKLKKRLH